MSEQEQIPEPRAWQSAADDEIEQAPQFYYKAARKDGKIGPKEEPPLSYDEPMVESQSLPDYQGGYAARDDASFTYPRPSAGAARANGGAERGRRQQSFKPGADGDAYENQYHPTGIYNQQQGNVPPWARPQPRQRGFPRVLVLIILAIMLIGPILHLLGTAFLVIGIMIAVMAFPFIVFAIFGLPFMLMRMITGRSGRRWRATSRMGPFWMGYRPRQRGPWWW